MWPKESSVQGRGASLLALLLLGLGAMRSAAGEQYVPDRNNTVVLVTISRHAQLSLQHHASSWETCVFY